MGLVMYKYIYIQLTEFIFIFFLEYDRNSLYFCLQSKTLMSLSAINIDIHPFIKVSRQDCFVGETSEPAQPDSPKELSALPNPKPGCSDRKEIKSWMWKHTQDVNKPVP